MAAFFVLVG